MPTRGLQFPTTIDPGLPDEPPVQLLSQWRQIKNGKAVPQEPPLVITLLLRQQDLYPMLNTTQSLENG